MTYIGKKSGVIGSFRKSDMWGAFTILQSEVSMRRSFFHIRMIGFSETDSDRKHRVDFDVDNDEN